MALVLNEVIANKGTDRVTGADKEVMLASLVDESVAWIVKRLKAILFSAIVSRLVVVVNEVVSFSIPFQYYIGTSGAVSVQAMPSRFFAVLFCYTFGSCGTISVLIRFLRYQTST